MKALTKIGIAFLVLIFISACATPNKTFLTGLNATNISIEHMAKKAKSYCQEGHIGGMLTYEDCEKIEKAYGKIKLADDAVIDTTKALINLGEDPENSASYQAALDDLMIALDLFIVLLNELGVIESGGQS